MQVRVGLVRGLLLRVPRQRALANLGDHDDDDYDNYDVYVNYDDFYDDNGDGDAPPCPWAASPHYIGEDHDDVGYEKRQS